jgi:hypothetical protein
MNPRTLCACHPTVVMISAKVAPFARPIIAKMVAPLLSLRAAFFCGPFLLGFADLLDFARAPFLAALVRRRP